MCPKRFGFNVKREGICIKPLMMKVLRLLAALVDVIIVMLPVQIVLIQILKIEVSQAETLFMFLFAVYGVLMTEYHKQQTFGKSFAKIKVVDNAGQKPTMVYSGIRELIKGMYFIPIIGWFVGMVSFFMLIFSDRTLHDLIANTAVVSVYEGEVIENV